MKSVSFSIPESVSRVTETLEKDGFEAYLVGGCVRDLFLNRTPKDWDVTTNAAPEKIQELFEETFYENDYGTVGVVDKDAPEESQKVVEVTPYRTESGYSDARRPDEVTFANTLEEDLKRRDFTINAMAYSPSKNALIDLYDGQEDARHKVIRTVGEPEERFGEDALRMLRAVRLQAELGFALDNTTAGAIKNMAQNLAKISRERVREEFVRILLSDRPMETLGLCRQLSLLAHIVPDLERGIGVDQNQAHSYDVFEHNLRTLQHAADKGWNIDLRLAALFHDISKPETRRWSDQKKDWTFHGHDVVGARLTRRIMRDLKFSNDVIHKVEKLVRWHMFFSDPDEVTLSAVRRTIRNVGGEENMWDLLNLRVCDRIGTGRPKEQPFRLRKYISMVEEALRDPISVGMLQIDGTRVMEITDEKPGARIGWILHALLEDVLDDPSRNTTDYLEERTKELTSWSDNELKKIGEAGKERREREEEAEIDKIREKYWVK